MSEQELHEELLLHVSVMLQENDPDDLAIVNSWHEQEPEVFFRLVDSITYSLLAIIRTQKPERYAGMLKMIKGYIEERSAHMETLRT